MSKGREFCVDFIDVLFEKETFVLFLEILKILITIQISFAQLQNETLLNSNFYPDIYTSIISFCCYAVEYFRVSVGVLIF